MTLSIIIPAYNAEPYIQKLVECLEPQLNDEVEVIIVDDGSKIPLNFDKKHVTVIRKENGGVSSARNVGIENSKGKYISFIDADDLVANDYVKQICAQMPFDYLEMSWKSLPGGIQYSRKLHSIRDRLDNPSACTRAFNRAFVGDVRFNENKDSAEDEDFTRRLDFEHGKRAVVTDYLYFYRTNVENSGSKRAMRGETKTKRIVYYFKRINPSMTYLIDEIKKEDEKNEVIIMTENNEIPELKKYAQIMQPTRLRGSELRGEYTPLFVKIVTPLRAEIVLWTDSSYEIGGVETFTYNFCKQMHEDYDILVLYNKIFPTNLEKLKKIVRVAKNDTRIPVECKTLLVNRIIDSIPANITYEQTIQMCHTCHMNKFVIPHGRDKVVCVSETARQTFGVAAKDAYVVNNMTSGEEPVRPLLLITASRLDTSEKGQRRIIKLAQLLNKAEIPFIWIYFSNMKLAGTPENLIYMKPSQYIRGYMEKADYVVQLSDSESFCYSLVEALELGVPVITTPLPVLKELGIDENMAHIVPFDITDDYDVTPIFNDRKQGFTYLYDNKARVKQWHDVIEEEKPKVYNKVIVTTTYNDVVLKKTLEKGMELMMEESRALLIQEKGYCRIID